MKPIQSAKRDERKECDPSSCGNCKECRVVDIEEGRTESRGSAPQLYAKEAENYFFYYALNMKQSS